MILPMNSTQEDRKGREKRVGNKNKVKNKKSRSKTVNEVVSSHSGLFTRLVDVLHCDDLSVR